MRHDVPRAWSGRRPSARRRRRASPHFGSAWRPRRRPARRVAIQHVFHLDGGDVLAARDDDVLAAILDLDVAVGYCTARSPEWNQPPRKALRSPGVLQVALHMAMLPRNMISPMVSPSCGTPAWSGRARRPRAAGGSARPGGRSGGHACRCPERAQASCLRTPWPGHRPGQAVDMGQVEAEFSMPSIIEAGGAALATI